MNPADNPGHQRASIQRKPYFMFKTGPCEGRDFQQVVSGHVRADNGRSVTEFPRRSPRNAIVTLVLAACAAMTHRGEIGNCAARGFNASAHVAKEATAPYRGPVYIGQSLVGIPATVIAQSGSWWNHHAGGIRKPADVSAPPSRNNRQPGVVRTPPGLNMRVAFFRCEFVMRPRMIPSRLVNSVYKKTSL